MTLPWRITSSRLIISCLFLSYIVASILSGANATSSNTLLTPKAESSLSLIICAVDGSIYTLDATSGTEKGYFGTGRPLVGSSSPSVVPGLDGSIYTLSEKEEEFKILPLTVQQVVQHPVQTCQGDDCGVVTGTKHTFLYGLDPLTGMLEWIQQYGKTDPHDESSDNPVVILHREDYVVRHISTSTGEEVWNITLGHVSALDFNTLWGSANNEDAPLLPPGESNARTKNKSKESTTTSAAMPSIAFGSEGTTVTAINEKHQVMWRRQLNTVIASVYGVVGNDFVPVTVVDTAKAQIDVQDDNTALVPLLPPRGYGYVNTRQRNLYLSLLWREAKGMLTSHAHDTAGGMVIFQPPPKNYRASADFRLLAQKATRCNGMFLDGVCYETPLLEAGESSQSSQPAGIYLTWDRMLVTLVLLGLGIRVLIAHNRRLWNAERQRLASKRQAVEGRLLNGDLQSSLSEHSAPPHKRLVDLGLSRVTSLPDLTNRSLMTSPGERSSKLWSLEKVELHRATTAPTDTAGQIDGIPFVKHSRYLSEFRELGPLGKGGFGTVYKCENVLDGRQYAIKKVRISSGEEFSQRLQRVLREIKSLAKLDHPNIVRYYTAWLEAAEDDGEGEDDAEGSSIGRCYSVELMTTSNNPPSLELDGRRPPGSPSVSKAKKTVSPYNDMANPLGWNGIDLDGSFDDNDHSVSQEGDDFGGFHFDRSTTDGSWDDWDNNGDDDSSNNSSSPDNNNKEPSLARSPADSAATPMASNRRKLSMDLSSSNSGDRPTIPTKSPHPQTKNVRHTLYIQMHLCSQKTLGDFLSNEEARKGDAVQEAVDIPLALSLFHQVAEGVKHVHEQGLIHRDLKPSNCFICDGVVKVGDFGLSRESSEPSATGEKAAKEDWVGGGGDDFSAGIGTRAYASPEQQKGSNYDSSTDVYSLGIMLFELCYPMCTVSCVRVMIDVLCCG